MTREKLKILTRGDDCGSFRTANFAIRDAVELGVLKNVSFIAVGNHFDEAARMFREIEGACLGIHLTINAEWDGIDWEPVLPASEIPSMVDSSGKLRGTPSDLHGKAEIDEIMKELKAQLQLAREKGLDIKYADEHCCFGWLGEYELRRRISRWCREEGLVYDHDPNLRLERLPKPSKEKDISAYLSVLESLDPGKIYRIVGHPCYPDEEIMNLRLDSNKSVSESRDYQRRIFMDPAVVSFFKENVDILKYEDFA